MSALPPLAAGGGGPSQLAGCTTPAEALVGGTMTEQLPRLADERRVTG